MSGRDGFPGISTEQLKRELSNLQTAKSKINVETTQEHQQLILDQHQRCEECVIDTCICKSLILYCLQMRGIEVLSELIEKSIFFRENTT